VKSVKSITTLMFL